MKLSVPDLSVLLYVYNGSPLPINSFDSNLTDEVSLKVKLYGGNHIILPLFLPSPGPISHSFRFCKSSDQAKFSIENINLFISLSLLVGAILTNPLASNTDDVISLNLIPAGPFPYKPLCFCNELTLSYLSYDVQVLQNVFFSSLLAFLTPLPLDILPSLIVEISLFGSSGLPSYLLTNVFILGSTFISSLLNNSAVLDNNDFLFLNP